MCPKDSQSPQCQKKTCPEKRKRRSLENHPRDRRSTNQDPVFGYLSGVTVNYKPKPKCKDLRCPSNSKCYDLYPAKCRADQGFVLSPSGNRSLTYTNETMFRLNNMRFHLIWRISLSNYNSLSFHALAVKTEEKLLKLIVQDFGISEVLTIKVDAARKGSIVVSMNEDFRKYSKDCNISMVMSRDIWN